MEGWKRSKIKRHDQSKFDLVPGKKVEACLQMSDNGRVIFRSLIDTHFNQREVTMKLVALECYCICSESSGFYKGERIPHAGSYWCYFYGFLSFQIGNHMSFIQMKQMIMSLLTFENH